MECLLCVVMEVVEEVVVVGKEKEEKERGTGRPSPKGVRK